MHSAPVSIAQPHFDHVIVGAGFAGLATAYFLARSGRSGIILEASDHVGAHASGRNAAMFRQQHDDRLLWELSQRTQHFLSQPEQQHCLRRQGSLLASHEAKDEVLANKHLAIGTSQLLTRHEVIAAHPYFEKLRFSSALWTSSDGVVDIPALLGIYLSGALERFALRLNCRVEGVRLQANQVELQTSQGVVPCRVVVNAAGAWINELSQSLQGSTLPLTAYKRHIFQVQNPPQVPVTAPFFWHLDDAYYLRSSPEAVLMSAGEEVASPAGDTQLKPDAVLKLQQQLSARCALWNTEAVKSVWACQRTYGKDQRPVVGWDLKQPWLFWVGGLGGTGVSTCAAVGEYAATLLQSPPTLQLAKSSGMQLERFDCS